MTLRQKITYLGVLVITGVLLAIAGVYDLQIDIGLYEPDNVVSLILDRAGIFPLPFIVAFAASVCFCSFNENKKSLVIIKNIICIVISLFILEYYFYKMLVGLMTKAWIVYVISAILSIAFTKCILLSVKRFKPETLQRLVIFFIFALAVVVLSTLIVKVIKLFWGRVRFMEMEADMDYLYSAFTPWYKPNGISISGHHSFPSGHTASAACMLVFAALPEVFPQWKSKQPWLFFVAMMYTIIVAFSRLIIGAHFLSDVVVGFLITFLCYAVGRYVFFRPNAGLNMLVLKVNEHEKIMSPAGVTADISTMDNDNAIIGEVSADKANANDK